MIIFYSGRDGGRADPEIYFGVRKTNMMLTYIESHGKKNPEGRFTRYCKLRKKIIQENKGDGKE